MSASHASTSGTLNPGSHYRPLKLSLATISCTLAMAGSRVRAIISQYWMEAANNGLSADRIKYFKAGLQWEMNLNVEDDALVLPEKLKNTSTPPLMGLRFIKEHMEALLEEQDQGIEAKMGEVKMYTDMLEKLRKGKGV
ncbi:uncharacterized protein F5891DRAFT_1194742 [Suillus fuscotomentosus]|uniref:Uncharacterized protein n=1 Tax=Suillus fuscotomentosus TaxID=1912939 RepID=A0AAD4HFT6_9AGAM|nr:uncharacterized protein F5891DRAFT_1194742 [Suillus fuscotomentosus]KAG1894927.1 hypothetical protein F5891DRAFT_1194742 [Suillus fuscotomentosus]